MPSVEKLMALADKYADACAAATIGASSQGQHAREVAAACADLRAALLRALAAQAAPGEPLTELQRMKIIGEEFPLALVQPIVIAKVDSVCLAIERAHGIGIQPEAASSEGSAR